MDVWRMDFCYMFVLALSRCFACTHIPIHLPTSYFLHIHPSIYSFFLSIIDSSFFLSFICSIPPPPAMMTEHGNRYFRNLHLAQQPSLPSFQYTQPPQTHLSVSNSTPAHQNPKRPISPSVSHPLSFIHRATAVLGRRVAHAERKRARCGGMECCLAFWYREGIWGVGLRAWMVLDGGWLGGSRCVYEAF